MAEPENTEVVEAVEPQTETEAETEAKNTLERSEDAEVNEPEVLDKHGQPGINKERHDREVAELNAKISELQAKVDEASRNEKTAQELREQIGALETTIKTNETRHALEGAGCLDIDLAINALDGYETVEALKEAKPYLFETHKQTNQGPTGFKPQAATSADKEFDDAISRAFGLA